MNTLTDNVLSERDLYAGFSLQDFSNLKTPQILQRQAKQRPLLVRNSGLKKTWRMLLVYLWHGVGIALASYWSSSCVPSGVVLARLFSGTVRTLEELYFLTFVIKLWA